MNAAVYPLDAESLVADVKAAEDLGKSFADKYQSGKPYHDICVDNFLPVSVVEKVREEALTMRKKDAENASLQEKNKASYHADLLPSYSRAALGALNSQAFLRFLEEMTGIPGLIPDPYFKGGGIHRTETGGFLGIHADFNQHKQMNLERRLNVLIYLNPDWKPEYGGAFEIWTSDMKSKVEGFTPIMNRMCCFSTSSNSYQGNPEPVHHPESEARLSIATYYYTATWDETKVAHSTLFRPRPGTSDVRSSKNIRDKVVQEMLPPALYRVLRRPLRKLKVIS